MHRLTTALVILTTRDRNVRLRRKRLLIVVEPARHSRHTERDHP